MDGYIQTAIGILVSVFFFIIGYRQTIGARKERAISANRSVYKALLRRLVLEDYSPKVDEINKLIEGKAQDFKVSPGDLQPDEQLLNQVFAEIFDNDFIAPHKRIEIEARLASAFDQLERGKRKNDDATLSMPAPVLNRIAAVAILGLIASLMGALVTLFIMLGNKLPLTSDFSLLKSATPTIVVFGFSLLIVVAISIAKTVREAASNATTRSTAAIESSLIENEVAAILLDLGVKFKIEPKVGLLRPDFIVEIAGQKLAIETKSWKTRPPINSASRAIRYLQEVIKAGGADDSVLVTRNRIPQLEKLAELDNVKVVALKDLADWIKTWSRSG